MINVKQVTTAVAVMIGLALLIAPVVPLRGDDAFRGGGVSWAPPKYSDVRTQVMSWRDEAALDDTVRAKVDEQWPADATDLPEIQALDRVVQTFALAIPGAQEVVTAASKSHQKEALAELPILQDQQQPAFVRDHLRLYYARWLIQNELYDEALEKLNGLAPEQVVAPATLLFHQSVAHHSLLHKEECLPTIARLLENEAAIPRRYREVARLMAADIEPLEVDSLDEIARLMDDVRRRLNLARAGKRVRDQEDEVIAKLDKMIEELQQQQQQQQAQQNGGGGSMQPNQPLDESRAAGGTGPGNVAQRDIGHGSGWGNLPPREREEALQDITKNLPAHYRAVIEEYFRKLARTNE